jgi:hypothetical protein
VTKVHVSFFRLGDILKRVVLLRGVRRWLARRHLVTVPTRLSDVNERMPIPVAGAPAQIRRPTHKKERSAP